MHFVIKIYKMRRITVIAVMLVVVGLVVASCNTHKRCPAYGNYSAVEQPPADDLL